MLKVEEQWFEQLVDWPTQIIHVNFVLCHAADHVPAAVDDEASVIWFRLCGVNFAVHALDNHSEARSDRRLVKRKVFRILPVARYE